MSAFKKRRWFQFRLRTLLVGIILIGAACHVAHEWQTVAARRAWITAHKSAWRGDSYTRAVTGFPDKRPSIIRRVLGDQQYTWLIVTSPEDVAEAQSLFPEACVGMIVLD